MDWLILNMWEAPDVESMNLFIGGRDGESTDVELNLILIMICR